MIARSSEWLGTLVNELAPGPSRAVALAGTRGRAAEAEVVVDVTKRGDRLSEPISRIVGVSALGVSLGIAAARHALTRPGE